MGVIPVTPSRPPADHPADNCGCDITHPKPLHFDPYPPYPRLRYLPNPTKPSLVQLGSNDLRLNNPLLAECSRSVALTWLLDMEMGDPGEG